MPAAEIVPAAAVDVEDYAAQDPAFWSVYHKIRLGSAGFTFMGHEYQRPVMQSRARRRH